MNILDDRSIGEQVRSGVRLAGFGLLTFALIGLLLVSIKLLGGGSVNLLSRFPFSGRFSGACALMTVCALMFLTVQHWAKWFFAFLCFSVVKAFAGFLMGRMLSAPTHAFPRWGFAITLDSTIVMWAGTGALCCAQLIDWGTQDWVERRTRRNALAYQQPGQSAK